MSTIAAPRHIVTAHDKDGNPNIIVDGPAPLKSFAPGANAFAVLHSTHEFPMNNTAELVKAPPGPPKVSANGTILAVTDFGPGLSSPMHRTETLDYCFMLEGEIELEFEKGPTITIKKGDIITQRGGIHQWHNRTKTWARIACVMIAAEKVKTENGQTLSTHFPAPPPAKA